jgi:hypothetical protein
MRCFGVLLASAALGAAVAASGPALAFGGLSLLRPWGLREWVLAPGMDSIRLAVE